MAGSFILAGCGKMGGAMLDGWIEGGSATAGVHVIEPIGAAVKRFSGSPGVVLHETAASVPADLSPAVVVLAVKPQTMDEAVRLLVRFVGPSTVFLSIAAGKTIGYFESQLGFEAAIVRAMPNTPAAVGRGITVYVPNERVTQEQNEMCEELLSAIGEVIEVTDENLLDPVTAVSGSGPAYVFLLIEAMAAAGVKAGLPKNLAERLARATVAGAGELARLSDEDAAQLRKNVTSPGGTTAAALKVLMADDGIQPVFDRALAAATNRSRELAG
ncbi:MAG: pyrroline-5-carboxylate reductase [Rhodospirillaceae bacterium]|nr:pyrroline-5-carboxylate reductase [Rhodospirillaceae bacterium]